MNNSGFGPEYVALGRTVRAVRQKAGVTQVDLATRLGQTQSYVSKCERGLVRLDFVQVRRICSLLGVEFVRFVRLFEKNLP